MPRNFKLIGGFGIAEKEIQQRKTSISQIIDKFYQIGIREFFVGYNPAYWHQEFGFEFSPNMRFGENEQITSFNTLSQVINYIHSLTKEDGTKCEINIGINYRYYSDITQPYIEKMIQELITLNVDGLIISNFEIAEYLAQIQYTGKINISTSMNVYNEDSIKFLLKYFQNKKLNLNRIIIPRELTWQEIKGLTSKFPNTKFEIFGQGDYCRYANGLCMSEHKYLAKDLCTFVLKHGLTIKKALKYNFKQIVLNPSFKDQEKQNLLDNELVDIQDTFVSLNFNSTNQKNNLINKYIGLLQSNQSTNQQEIAQGLYQQIHKELTLNFAKYIWDGMRSEYDIHNQYILNFLTLYSLIVPEIQKQDIIEKKIIKIKLLQEMGQAYYEKQKNIKGKFGIEANYKFLFYNRSSLVLYKLFNEISNIEIVKIPLRGRDLNLFKLGLELIDDAIVNSDKYIDMGNISGKYFHYDLPDRDIYINKLIG